jgi:O-antigen ligase
MSKGSSSAAATLQEGGQFHVAAARASHVLSSLIFGSLLAIIVLTAVPYGTVEPWWTALFECAIFALTILWIIDGFLSGSWLVRTHRLLLPLLILVAYCLVQAMPLAGNGVAGIQVRQTLSADPYQTKLIALKLLALTFAAAMLLRYTSSTRRRHALIFTVIGVALLSALFGLVRQTTQREYVGFVLPYLRMGSGYGQFINKNHFAFLMEMALGLALGIVAGAPRAHKPIYLGAALPIWAALVLSNSRGGLFAMLAQALFLGFIVFSSRPGGGTEGLEDSHGATLFERFGRSVLLRGVLLVCLAVILFVGAIWMGGEQLVTRLESVPGEMSSARPEEIDGASRKVIWQATWQMIKEHPIVGIGFGGYWAAIPQYHQASGQTTPQEAHNDYLELLASGGVIGLGLLIWFLLIFIRRVRASLRRAKGFTHAAIVGAVTGLFGVAVHSFVDFGLHVTINLLVAIALVAIAACGVEENGSASRQV